MAYQQKPGQGVLFRNDRKDSDRHPDYRGQATDENGNEYWLSGWIKDGARGKFLSLALQRKDGQASGEESQDEPF